MTARSNVPHPLFHHAYDLLTLPIELSLRPLRKRLVSGLRGEGVELGAGSGNNLAHYASGVTIHATEPDPVMLHKAERKAKDAVASIRLEDAPAEDLSHLADGSQDFAVATLAFCTIQDVEGALQELRRVLKPNACVHLLEHVQSTRPWVQRTFEAIHGPWKWAFGGCRMGQDTQALFRAAGFVIENERYYSSYMVRFSARPQ